MKSGLDAKPLFLQVDMLKAYSKVKNPKAGTFFRAPEDLEGLRSQKIFIFQNAQKQV